MKVHPETGGDENFVSIELEQTKAELGGTRTEANEELSWRRYYTAEELAFWRCQLLKDGLGMPVAAGWYFVLAAVMQQFVLAVGFTNAGEGDGGDSPPVAVLLLQASMAAAASAALLVHCLWDLPPNSGDSARQLRAYLGQWIYLTQHCLALQGVHFVVSVAAAAFGWHQMTVLANGMTLALGAMGSFVTVQYFTLCHFHPDFRAKCAELMERTPPFNLSRVGIVVHVPALPLALLDVVFAKERGALRVQSPILATLVIILFYVLFYLGFICTNYRATERWPYPVLKSLVRLHQWVLFVVVQIGVIGVFGLLLWALTFTPAIWP